MAELNWIPKEERLPTAEDADTQGFIIAFDHRGAMCYHFTNVANLPQCSHWIGFKQPVKRWRVPTIHDLAKAGKPIPCRMKNAPSESWKENGALHAIDLYTHALRRFMVDCGWYEFCEICDE